MIINWILQTLGIRDAPPTFGIKTRKQALKDALPAVKAGVTLITYLQAWLHLYLSFQPRNTFPQGQIEITETGEIKACPPQYSHDYASKAVMENHNYLAAHQEIKSRETNLDKIDSALAQNRSRHETLKLAHEEGLLAGNQARRKDKVLSDLLPQKPPCRRPSSGRLAVYCCDALFIILAIIEASQFLASYFDQVGLDFLNLSTEIRRSPFMVYAGIGFALMCGLSLFVMAMEIVKQCHQISRQALLRRALISKTLAISLWACLFLSLAYGIAQMRHGISVVVNDLPNIADSNTPLTFYLLTICIPLASALMHSKIRRVPDAETKAAIDEYQQEESGLRKDAAKKQYELAQAAEVGERVHRVLILLQNQEKQLMQERGTELAAIDQLYQRAGTIEKQYRQEIEHAWQENITHWRTTVANLQTEHYSFLYVASSRGLQDMLAITKPRFEPAKSVAKIFELAKRQGKA